MKPRVHLIQVLNSGLVRLAYDGDAGIWTRSEVRKSHRCVLTDKRFEPGSEMFRPIGNQMYRAKRISAEVIDGMVDLLRERGELSDDELEALEKEDA